MACAGQFEQWWECWPLDSQCEQWLDEHELEYRLWIFLKIFEFSVTFRFVGTEPPESRCVGHIPKIRLKPHRPAGNQETRLDGHMVQ